MSYTITPAIGYRIADVLVDGVSVGAMTSYNFINVTSNHTISANFAINTNAYTITATAGANGSIAPAGVSTVNHGGIKNYTITPATGYHIADVLVDGVSVRAVTNYSFINVTSNHTISASFVTNINAYTITATAGANGSIAPLGVSNVNHGGSMNYTITPATGYSVADVLVDGVSVGEVTSYNFINVTSNHTITASFTNIYTYTITATAGVNGSIAPAGSTTVNFCSSQNYTITPNVNYGITDVLVDNVLVGNVTSYSFTNVKANHTISASFSVLGETRILVNGWALVSVPRYQSDYRSDIVFAGNDLNMYSYSTRKYDDYDVASILTLGQGFWVHYKNPTIVIIRGPETGPLTVTADTNGWVLLGSRVTPVEIS
jgi:hypothetical protein